MSFSSAAGGAYWPIAICCPSLGPFPSIGSGAHRPLTTLCPSSSSLPYLFFSLSLSFPLVGSANRAPDFPYFNALTWVHTEEGKCRCRWPGAFKRSSQTGGEGPLPNGGFWALGFPLVGSFPRREHITTFCLYDPALSRPCGECIMYPYPPFMSMVCVLSLRSHVCHAWVWWVAGGIGCWAGMGGSSCVCLV